MNRDSMMGQNHDVYHEFPEFLDQIKSLQSSDLEFARLCDEYNQLNREVIRVEQHIEPVSQLWFRGLEEKAVTSQGYDLRPATEVSRGGRDRSRPVGVTKKSF